MDLFSWAERLMTMDDITWARHANPWSVWTRFLTPLPLLSVAIWSRVWLGWSFLWLIGLVLAWIWYNPRAFPPPKSTNNWGAKATFGERIFLEQRPQKSPVDATESPKPLIAQHHLRAVNILTLMSLLGTLIWGYGLYALDFWAMVAGLIATVIPKAWFCDRMVWIYEEMKDTDPTYSGWLK